MTIDLRERRHNLPPGSHRDPSRRAHVVAVGTAAPARANPTLRTSNNSRSHHLLIALVILSGLGAALMSTASPAGIAAADATYRGLFACVIVWFAARSRRWTFPVLAGLAVISTASLFGQIISTIALAIALHAMASRRRRRPTSGALVAALSVPPLLTQGVGPVWRLTGGEFDDRFATSAVITALATGPIIASGWKTMSRRRRRSIRRMAVRSGLAIGAIIVVSTTSAFIAMPSMLAGLEHTQAATQAANDGDLVRSSAAFDDAAAEWASANRVLTGPWMTPGRLVPIVGQHVRAAQVVTGQASALTSSAQSLTERLDPDALIVDGRVEVAEVDALRPAAEALAATTERAAQRITAAHSDWLIPPLAQRMDRAIDLLGRSSGLAGASSEALHVGVDLLGGQTPSQILVMVSTPAEARGAGGFIGNWVLLDATNGVIEVREQYHSRELNTLLEERSATLRADSDYFDRYERFDVARHIQDVTLSPDFPSVAAVAADLFAQATDIHVDAILLVDPFALEKLLGFTGPIDMGTDTPLTGANAAQELLIDQYQRFEDDERARESSLLGLTEVLMERLVENPPDPVAFITELAPLAEQNRISLWLSDDDGSIVERLGVSGSFPRSDDGLLAVVHQNAGQNKIDPYLERSVDVRTTISPSSSRVDHRVTITLDNTAPSSDLADAVIASNDLGLPRGANRLLLSVYSSDRLTNATLDGQPAAVEHAREFGAYVYTTLVTIGPGEFSVLDLELIGEANTPNSYEVTLGAQPLAAPDQLSWRLSTDDGTRITPPEGWSVDPDGVRWAAPLDRTEHLDFDLGG